MPQCTSSQHVSGNSQRRPFNMGRRRGRRRALYGWPSYVGHCNGIAHCGMSDTSPFFTMLPVPVSSEHPTAYQVSNLMPLHHASAKPNMLPRNIAVCGLLSRPRARIHVAPRRRTRSLKSIPRKGGESCSKKSHSSTGSRVPWSLTV